MATVIQIKRSSSTSAPATLKLGELAFTYGTGTQGNLGDRLFIGEGGVDGNGDANNISVIGGQYFAEMLDHVQGTLTANGAVIVDDNKAVDELIIGNATSVGVTVKFNEGTNNGANDLVPIFLKCEKPIDWITVAAVWRLWESEYMRLPGFKREISHWISNQNITQNGNPDGSNPDDMVKFRNEGGNYFVKLAENIIQSKNQVVERLAALEALRFFVKKIPIECLPIVAKKINFLMDNNESR